MREQEDPRTEPVERADQPLPRDPPPPPGWVDPLDGSEPLAHLVPEGSEG